MRKAALLASMTPDERFFFEHAGFSYDPKTETLDEGRARGAVALAAAEAVYLQAHRVADVGCLWEHDPDWDNAAEGAETNEMCAIWHRTGPDSREYLASLWSINDADETHRRIVRAELAAECLDALVQIIADAKQPA